MTNGLSKWIGVFDQVLKHTQQKNPRSRKNGNQLNTSAFSITILKDTLRKKRQKMKMGIGSQKIGKETIVKIDQFELNEIKLQF